MARARIDFLQFRVILNRRTYKVTAYNYSGKWMSLFVSHEAGGTSACKTVSWNGVLSQAAITKAVEGAEEWLLNPVNRTKRQVKV